MSLQSHLLSSSVFCLVFVELKYFPSSLSASIIYIPFSSPTFEHRRGWWWIWSVVFLLFSFDFFHVGASCSSLFIILYVHLYFFSRWKYLASRFVPISENGTGVWHRGCGRRETLTSMWSPHGAVVGGKRPVYSYIFWACNNNLRSLETDVRSLP